MDRFDGRELVRCAYGETGFQPYVCDVPQGLRTHLEVMVVTPAVEPLARPVLGRLFVTAGSDWSRLLAGDATLRDLNARFPGVRPVLQHDLFTALVRSISAQQINLRWAAVIRARLAERYGVRRVIGRTFVYSLDPRRIAAAKASEIRALQFTTRKAEAVVDLARVCVAGDLSLASIAGETDEEIVARLTALRGIGLWSAEWILCRTLGRPRVVAGDLGVRKAVGRAYLGGAMPSEPEVRGLTAHWGPSAAVAQALVLEGASMPS